MGRKKRKRMSKELNAESGAGLAAASGYAAPATPGFYWIRHHAKLKGEWQPVAVDNHFGVLGFQKFGWTGWMAVEEAANMDMEWGGEVTCPHNDKTLPTEGAAQDS